MSNGKRFKVLAIMPKSDGSGDYFTRIGTGFENKDSSINLYVDLVPVANGKNIKLQVRELDENDLKKRESYSSRTTDRLAVTAADAPPF